MDAIELSLFSNRINAICEEMGAVLRRAAFSPNIMDRLDFSCAVFDAQGELCAQAAHIPVHLGSMAFAMRDTVAQIDWHAGDTVILNDPFLGGTHLPDVTLISPLLVDGKVRAFVANRAHHADIGTESPGSMPISRRLDEEGMIIPPSKLNRAGRLDEVLLDAITSGTRNPRESRGDFSAQLSANRTGIERVSGLLQQMGAELFTQALSELNDYAERLACSALQMIPDGRYSFHDYLDDDGAGHEDIPIAITLTRQADRIDVDFSGTSAQVAGNINCPLSVAAAAVYYVFRCLMPPYTPACQGSFRPIRLHAPRGCLVNAQRPAAVAAGNVETSTRIVDVVLGALAQAIPEYIPAASHGSMNNLAMGSRVAGHTWDYYETIGGGMGASHAGDGVSAVQTHMTNTLNTPIEVLELRYPLRIRQYGIRRNSGGQGRHRGGDGIVREFEFLQPAQVTVLSERRRRAPWGQAGGRDGQRGQNWKNGQLLPGKAQLAMAAGDCLKIETPGGGGWGHPETDG